MPKLKICAVFLGMFLGLAALARTAIAQDENAQKPEDAKAKSAFSQSLNAYRLEFTVSEMEDGKKINARNYSMLAQGGYINGRDIYNKIRVGARIPASTTNDLHYIDTGTNIDCAIREQEGHILLDITIDSSNIILSPTQKEISSPPPVIQQMKVNMVAVLVSGKPAVIASLDDPSSKRTFQIEATATKVK